MTLYDALNSYAASDAYPFHMPGHKRNPEKEGAFWPPLIREWMRCDITEIDNFDNLHHAEGVLREAMDLAAGVYHADRSYFLINGSTCGVLAAISAAAPAGSKILMMRSSHKSAYHAVVLRRLHPVYLYSAQQRNLGLDLGITLEDIQRALEQHPDVSAVFLTSPSYEGFSLPLGEIAGYLHARRIPLIVDAAHGSHFGLAEFLPENALQSGADLVIHSLHKTLPAPTQTALLHVNGSLVAAEEVEKYLGFYETSSPSYPMMAAIDLCIRYIAGDHREQWQQFYGLRRHLTEQISGLKHIGVLDYFHQEKQLGLRENERPEIGKMILYIRHPLDPDRDGKWLYDRLRLTYHLQPELSLPGYVLLFLTLFDTPEGYQRLADALLETDRELSGERNRPVKPKTEGEQFYGTEEVLCPKAEVALPDAFEMPAEWCDYRCAEGKISGGFLQVYPPGQPLLVPGERIDAAVIDRLEYYRQHRYELQGMQEERLRVLREEKSRQY